MITKSCTCCGETKSVSEFYKRLGYRDGIQAHCKTCERAKTAGYQRSKAGREMLKRHSRRDYEKFKEKQNARVSVRRAILSGNLVKPNYCSACLNDCRPHAHHRDYSKPLEVIWLCLSCHRAEHKSLVLTGANK